MELKQKYFQIHSKVLWLYVLFTHIQNRLATSMSQAIDI